MTDEIKEIPIENIIKFNKYIPILPFSNQLLFLRSREQEILYGGAARGGKMSPVETQVVTPFGLRKLGDLKVGDKISTPDGSAATVIQIHEHGEKDVYKVTFVDGRSLEVGLEHLWKIKRTRTNRRKSNKNGEGGWFIADTEWMINCLNNDNSYNLAVPLTESVNFTKAYKYDMRPVSPYAVGVFLGDGCLTRDSDIISLTSSDNEIIENLKNDGYEPIRVCESINEKTGIVTKDIIYNGDIINGFEKIGLRGRYSYNKFIPEYYKYASIDDRISLIQGLMDTDGYVDDRGHLSYTTTSEQLAKDVQWIIRSLGGRASITSKIPTYTYEEIKKEGRLAYTVWIQIKDKDRLVRLARKKERCKDKKYIGGFQDPSLTIEKIEYSRKAVCRCITISHIDGLYLADDFIVTHNSVSLLAAALQYVDVPGYHALIIRRNFSELNLAGALIPMSKEWLTNTDARWDMKNNTWHFPSGASLTFGYLEHKDDIFRYLGSEYQFIGFDELTEHPIDNYLFLFSRLVRTKKMEEQGIPLRMRATTNPGGAYGEWVYERFIDKNTRQKYRQIAIEDIMLERDCKVEDISEEDIRYRIPRFIPSKVIDNPHVDVKTYLASLSKLDPVKRAQYLHGDWEIREMGNMFNRSWIEIVRPSAVPLNDLRCARYWDLAATVKSSSDYTATAKIGYDRTTGLFYILDVEMMKGAPHEIESRVLAYLNQDGPHCYIYMEQEPGSSGLVSIDNYKRKVIPPGYMFYPDRVTGSKEDRARPLSAAMGNGLIKIVDFPKRKLWYNDVMNQLEVFPAGDHDDGVDALSGCFNSLTKMIRSSAAYIGKLETIEPVVRDNEYLPEYAQPAKGRNIVDMITNGNPNDIFVRRP